MSEPLRTEAARLKAQRDGGVIQVNDGDNFECIVCGAISSFLYGLVHATACYVDLREAENARLTSEVSRLREALERIMRIDQAAKRNGLVSSYEGFGYSAGALVTFDLALTDIFEAAKYALVPPAAAALGPQEASKPDKHVHQWGPLKAIPPDGDLGRECSGCLEYQSEYSRD